MPLTNVEREKITDSVLKIQSVQVSLRGIDEKKIRDFDEIDRCLRTAHQNLRLALADTSQRGQ